MLCFCICAILLYGAYMILGKMSHVLQIIQDFQNLVQREKILIWTLIHYMTSLRVS